MKSVLQDWVAELGLRHQGVLLTAVRGCDTAPKEDASKKLTRFYRSFILNAHCGDARKAATFIQMPVDQVELLDAMKAFRKNCDHYPHHYVAHVTHAAEVLGYKYAGGDVWKQTWLGFYYDLCRCMHANPETEAQMDLRLGADEVSFAAADKR